NRARLGIALAVEQKVGGEPLRQDGEIALKVPRSAAGGRSEVASGSDRPAHGHRGGMLLRRQLSCVRLSALPAQRNDPCHAASSHRDAVSISKPFDLVNRSYSICCDHLL